MTNYEKLEDLIQINNENKRHGVAGTLCILYLLLWLILISWQLFDVWIGQHSLARLIRYELEPLDTAVFRLVFFTVLGGALGGVINGIRSILEWYPVFDRVYAWKYIVAPWLGAALALIAYTLLNSGVSILGGGNIADANAAQILTMFSTGFLAGYGAQDVFTWLDSKVSRLFDPHKAQTEIAAAVVKDISKETEAVRNEADENANYEADKILALNNLSAVVTPIANNTPHLEELSGSH